MKLLTLLRYQADVWSVRSEMFPLLGEWSFPKPPFQQRLERVHLLHYRSSLTSYFWYNISTSFLQYFYQFCIVSELWSDVINFLPCTVYQSLLFSIYFFPLVLHVIGLTYHINIIGLLAFYTDFQALCSAQFYRNIQTFDHLKTFV